MPAAISIFLAIFGAYFLGSIPMGIFFVRAYKGIDIRDVGSGRTGGTNALRAAGWFAGILTGLSDILKGFTAVYIGRLLMPGVPWVEAACGVAVVVGHNWSAFIGFKGGAGAATNVGVVTALFPYALPVIVVPAMIIFLVSGYASVTTTFVGVSAPIILAVAARVYGLPLIYLTYGVSTLILIALALVPNYRRLLNGTERVVGPRAKAMAAKRDQNGIAASGA